jgi:hypothetical protein
VQLEVHNGAGGRVDDPHASWTAALAGIHRPSFA